jgi:hypothetical protein
MVIAGLVLAIAAAAVGQWLSSGFSIQVARFGFAGWVWGWLGFIVVVVAC